MRAFIVISSLLVSAATALACPPGARCATRAPQPVYTVARREVAAPAARSVSLTVDRTHRAPERARWTMRDLPAKASYRAPMVWQAIRTKVAEKLPTYRSPRGISLTVSPVVVVSDAFDSAPCLGITGGF